MDKRAINPYDDIYVRGLRGKPRHLFTTERFVLAFFAHNDRNSWVVTKEEAARAIRRGKATLDRSVTRLRREGLLTSTIIRDATGAARANDYAMTDIGAARAGEMLKNLCDKHGHVLEPDAVKDRLHETTTGSCDTMET